MGDIQPRISYAQLRAWIEAQESYERQSGRPAPLTNEQRRAMTVLVVPSPPPSAVLAPPPAALPAWTSTKEADINWIGLLMQYGQSSPYQDPEGCSEFIEEPVPRPGGAPPLWRCWCRLPREAPTQRFPDTANEEDMQRSVFLRKKDAKKYAARCAVKWLIANNFMQSDGNAVTLTGRRQSALPPSPPSRLPVLLPTAAKSAQKAQSFGAVGGVSATLSSSPTAADEGSALEEYRMRLSGYAKPTTPVAPADVASPPPPPPLLQPGAKVSSMATWQQGGPGANSGGATKGGPSTSSSASSASASASTSTPAKRRRGSNGDGDGEKTSSVHSLQALCRALGLAMPELRVTACDGQLNFFDGVAVFPQQKSRADRADPVALPPGVGVADMVYTREATREKIAQSVLAHLIETRLSSAAAAAAAAATTTAAASTSA